MSLDSTPAAAVPVTTVGELVNIFAAAGKPRTEHRLGLEHEKLIYPRASRVPVPYEGSSGIGELLARLATQGGFTAHHDGPGGPIIALARRAQLISLEPGGQLELSGSPAFTAREVHRENLAHVEELRQVLKALDLRAVALGYRPFAEIEAMPWMPKARYTVMRQTLGRRGRLAHDMMLMTATGQASLDWEDEADAVRKFVAVSRLTPLLVALYANSPLARGAPTGVLSYRNAVWEQVDPARCGYLGSAFDGSFSFEAYVQWALDVPLLFLRRAGRYLTPTMTFRQLLAEGHEGGPALLSDWVDHLSTLFPHVRLKRVLEVRAADACALPLTGALPALLRGTLYEPSALDDVLRLLPPLALSEQLALHAEAQTLGLEGRWRGAPLAALARELLVIARRGLMRLDPADASLLEPLEALAEQGRSPARRVLDVYEKSREPSRLLGAFVL